MLSTTSSASSPLLSPSPLFSSPHRPSFPLPSPPPLLSSPRRPPRRPRRIVRPGTPPRPHLRDARRHVRIQS
ncbi:uncharacterized protein SCHCODRAFT_02630342 [Schizophyllum commune H4-8]|uniref:uncharacterized protein n=1 Tax=Schizophyllum commune (strain H4-8 / FGSC 9210) TaxID=578458 RepID=UPI00215EFAA4|nr:uncharacterized protein SCHCODRAFT_02630342 [Schizophyllum commune H4-8]KAI5889891.1 hypothetical protein SCHCODRAFT_02630342 [Schizophyllum commune H4-8]